MNEKRLGGLLLMLGIITILVTIVFEFKVGWIGTDRPREEVPQFIYETWSALKFIWGWQMVAHVFIALAFMQFAIGSRMFMRLLWQFLALCEILAIVAFGFVLGSYYPALEVLDEQPALFQSIRGGIRTLYMASYLSVLLFIIPFCLETFKKNGKIIRAAGVVTLIVMIGTSVIGTALSYSGQISGLGTFLLPLVFGYFYWRNG